MIKAWNEWKWTNLWNLLQLIFSIKTVQVVAQVVKADNCHDWLTSQYGVSVSQILFTALSLVKAFQGLVGRLEILHCCNHYLCIQYWRFSIADLSDKSLFDNDIKSLEGWEKKWLLEFNTSKCKVLHLEFNNNKQLDYE